jgi:hypothetical protein
MNISYQIFIIEYLTSKIRTDISSIDFFSVEIFSLKCWRFIIDCFISWIYHRFFCCWRIFNENWILIECFILKIRTLVPWGFSCWWIFNECFIWKIHIDFFLSKIFHRFFSIQDWTNVSFTECFVEDWTT